MLKIYETILGYKQTWYIDFKNEDEITFDIEYQISKNMGITKKNFKATIINQFNGYLFGDAMLCFKTKEDAEIALEWIESNMILHKLSGE